MEKNTIKSVIRRMSKVWVMVFVAVAKYKTVKEVVWCFISLWKATLPFFYLQLGNGTTSH